MNFENTQISCKVGETNRIEIHLKCAYDYLFLKNSQFKVKFYQHDGNFNHKEYEISDILINGSVNHEFKFIDSINNVEISQEVLFLCHGKFFFELQSEALIESSKNGDDNWPATWTSKPPVTFNVS